MQNLRNSLGRILPFLKATPKIERSEALAIMPMRHPYVEWEYEGKEIILKIPLRDDKWARLIKKMSEKMPGGKDLPNYRQLALDEVGSFVWELCDGESTVNDIILDVMDYQKLSRREAEASVTLFLQTLVKRNLVGLLSAGGKSSGKRK
ncbi:MAG: PqqD family protein [Armatimonadota bacterium]